MKTLEKIEQFLEGMAKTDFAITDVMGDKRSEVDSDLVLEKARAVLDGYGYFDNREKVFIGEKNIDWRGGQKEHQEWRAQLNRFFMLAYLERAYAITQDDVYPQRAKALMEDWLDFVDEVQEGDFNTHKTDNRLNLSIRLGHSHHSGWMGCLKTFVHTEAFDEAFVERVFDSMERQITVLLNKGINLVGNWRISQLDTMIMLGLRCPFMSCSEKLLDYAVPRLFNTFKHQIMEDGSHIEMTPSYHGWMSRVFLNYYKISRAFPELKIVNDTKKVALATKLLAYYGQFAMNDTQYNFNNRDVGFGGLKKANEGLLALDEEPMTTPLPDLYCDKAGYWFLGDEQDNMLMFDVSKYGASHTHSSRLELCLNRKGKPMLIDPGFLTYEMTNPLGPYGKSTAAHSTININGYNQCPANAQMILQHAEPKYGMAEACYDGSFGSGRNLWGFTEGMGKMAWARHYRCVFMVKNEYVLVIDAVHAAPGDKIHNNWSIAPFEEVAYNEDELSVTAKDPDGSNLFSKMLLKPEGDVTGSLVSGYREGDDLRGWACGGAQGSDVAHPHWNLQYDGGLPAGGISAMVFAPFEGDDNPWVMRPFQVENAGSMISFSYVSKEGFVDKVSWVPNLHGAIDVGNEEMSDGSFLFVRRSEGGEWLDAYSPNGSYIRNLKDQ